jgi:hypothetical protein
MLKRVFKEVLFKKFKAATGIVAALNTNEKIKPNPDPSLRRQLSGIRQCSHR